MTFQLLKRSRTYGLFDNGGIVRGLMSVCSLGTAALCSFMLPNMTSSFLYLRLECWSYLSAFVSHSKIEQQFPNPLNEYIHQIEAYYLFHVLCVLRGLFSRDEEYSNKRFSWVCFFSWILKVLVFKKIFLD